MRAVGRGAGGGGHNVHYKKGHMSCVVAVRTESHVCAWLTAACITPAVVCYRYNVVRVLLLMLLLLLLLLLVVALKGMFFGLAVAAFVGDVRDT
jgi:hypothetical protein